MPEDCIAYAKTELGASRRTLLVWLYKALHGNRFFVCRPLVNYDLLPGPPESVLAIRIFSHWVRQV